MFGVNKMGRCPQGTNLFSKDRRMVVSVDIG